MVRLTVVHLLVEHSMSRTAFAQTIISKLRNAIGTSGMDYSNGSADIAMRAVADGITEYLIANTLVTVSYTGIIPGSPPSPDPLTTDTFKIMGKCEPTGPSENFNDWIKKIESNIIAGFQLEAAGTNNLVFSLFPFSVIGISTSQSHLKSVHDIGDKDPQLKVWEVVCQGIMDWINGISKNVTPGPASHPPVASTGTAQITKITLT